MGILGAAVITIIPTEILLKVYSLVQLIFDHDMIVLIKHTVNWELIRQ